MTYQTFQINDQFLIKTITPTRKIELSDDVYKTVEEIWQQEAKRSQGRLFNGKLLSMVSWDKDHLVGEFVDYKYFLAQTRNPQLESKLKIYPVAISGITYSGNQVLFGLRSETVSQNPLCYELAPSGGVDPSALEDGAINLHRLALRELEEETGLTAKDVTHVRLFALAYEPAGKSFEICVEIHVHPSIARSRILPIDEYMKFFWVDKNQTSHFVYQHREKMVPMSRQLLELKGIAL